MSGSCGRCDAPLASGRFELCPVCLLTAELPAIELGGDLELREEIGRGGMGVVYRARDRRLGRDVAVKLLREDLAGDTRLRERFEREARALASLTHKYIVTVFDVGRDESQVWMVLELITGPRVSELVPLERNAALALMAEIAGALAYAHARGVVHRDIKPENVLIDEDGHARLVDFGLAALLESSDARLTLTGQAVGTPAYMAPEVLSGAQADARVDVYGAGVLFYQLVTGGLPLGAFEPLEGDLQAFVERTLATDPAQRFADGGELHAAVQALQRGSSRAEGRERGSKLSAEERLWLWATAMVNSVATAAVLWAFYRSVMPRVAEPGQPAPLMVIRDFVDGREVERARFETWSVLGALSIVALAAALSGLLYRHWKRAGLLVRQPDRPLPESRRLLRLGLVLNLLYGLRLIAGGAGLTGLVSYTPILGGPLELLAVVLFWLAVLSAWRTGRPLRREPRLWLGALLCLVPPVTEMLRFLSSWTP